jgi:adenine/guanine/hypoxanthine permease
MAAPTQKPQGRKPPPALIFVAYLRAASLGAIKWEDPTEYIPPLITALLMPLSYSIATGIGLDFFAYVVLKAFAGRFREINAAVGVIAAAFLLRLIFA